MKPFSQPKPYGERRWDDPMTQAGAEHFVTRCVHDISRSTKMLMKIVAENEAKYLARISELEAEVQTLKDEAHDAMLEAKFNDFD